MLALDGVGVSVGVLVGTGVRVAVAVGVCCDVAVAVGVSLGTKIVGAGVGVNCTPHTEAGLHPTNINMINKKKKRFRINLQNKPDHRRLPWSVVCILSLFITTSAF
jgi:hypothetical protein